MHHLHFKTIDSTQTYLCSNLADLRKISSNILISAKEQTSGVGRRGNIWDFYPNSIAMSFTIEPHSTPTLTPIEIGVLTAQFLKKEFDINIKLKWPNDLLTNEGKKCGGIISQYLDNKAIVAGIGLNLGPIENLQAPLHYKHGLGILDSRLQLSENDYQNIPFSLYNFLLANRLSGQSLVKDEFNKYCWHMNHDVLIEDEEIKMHGKFLGIGLNGEAVIEINGERKTFLSGSLKILNEH